MCIVTPVYYRGFRFIKTHAFFPILFIFWPTPVGMGVGEQARPELVVITCLKDKSGSLLISCACHILSGEMRIRDRKMSQNAAFRAFIFGLGLVLLLVSPHNDICRNTMMTDGNEKKVLTIVLWDSLGCKLGLECPSEDVLVFFFCLFMVFYLFYDRTQRGILS